MSEENARQIAADVARRSYGKLVALLASRTRDVASAEDALSEALVSALSEWPANGIPDAPEAWLLTVARRRLIDAARRRRTRVDAKGHLELMADELEAAAGDAGPIPDQRLALMFACAHPAIAPSVRAPLILQTILGFDAAAVGSAFLVSPATMAQRLVRAKKKIKDAGIPLEVPERPNLAARLDAVLEAIYAAFAEGWSDPLGIEARRRDLAEEAIFLGRLVVSLLPDEAESLGLLALMLYAQARREARRDAGGEFVPLEEQDPRDWDEDLIAEAEALLTRANGLPGSGRYQLEAAVQSAHVVRRRTGSADWAAIEAIYGVLTEITGSPVVIINRAVAVARSRGAAAGIAELDTLADDARMRDYQPYWAARADLLARAGAVDEADRAYEQAIGLETDAAVRRFLQRRRAALAGQSQ